MKIYKILILVLVVLLAWNTIRVKTIASVGYGYIVKSQLGENSLFYGRRKILNNVKELQIVSGMVYVVDNEGRYIGIKKNELYYFSTYEELLSFSADEEKIINESSWMKF